MSANTRYPALNDAVFAARGEDIYLDIEGPTGERLATLLPTPSPPSPPAPRCSCTCRSAPQDFAAHWNAAQALAGPQLALGRELAVLLRPAAVGRDPDRAVQPGHRHPRGRAEEPGRAPAGLLRRALDHLDLRPVRGERPLLPGAAAGDHRRGPGGGARARARRRGCRSCGCTTARSTAGTARSTTSSTAARTCGSRTASCRPARRIVDVMANAAFYYGVAAHARRRRPAGLDQDELRRGRAQLPQRGARRASTSRLYWPGFGEVAADELVLRHLLPLAHEGLEQWGVSAAVRDRYLAVIEGRCTSGMQRRRLADRATVARLEERGARPPERAAARCSSATSRACTANEPVHTWQVP